MKYLSLPEVLFQLRKELNILILADDLKQKLNTCFESCDFFAVGEPFENVVCKNLGLLDEVCIACKVDLDGKLNLIGILRHKLNNYLQNTHRRINILLKRSHANVNRLAKFDADLENEVTAVFIEILTTTDGLSAPDLAARIARVEWRATDLVTDVLEASDEKLLAVFSELLNEYGNWFNPALDQLRSLGIAELNIVNLRSRAREIRFGGLSRVARPVFKWPGYLYPKVGFCADSDTSGCIRQAVRPLLKTVEQALAEHVRLLRAACFMGAENEAAYLKPQLVQMLLVLEKDLEIRRQAICFNIKPQIDKLWPATALAGKMHPLIPVELINPRCES